MGLLSLGNRSLNDNLTVSRCYLGRIIKEMESEFCRHSYQKDLRQIATKDILFEKKEKTIFLVSDD